MELTDELLEQTERNARAAQHLAPGLLAVNCSPELIIALVAEVRRLRVMGGWCPPNVSLVSTLRVLDSLQEHLSDVLLDVCEDVKSAEERTLEKVRSSS